MVIDPQFSEQAKEIPQRPPLEEPSLPEPEELNK